MSDDVRYEGRQAVILPPVAQGKIGHRPTCRNIRRQPSPILGQDGNNRLVVWQTQVSCNLFWRDHCLTGPRRPWSVAGASKGRPPR